MFQFEDTSGLDDEPGGQSGGVRPRANRGRTMLVVAALVVVAGGGAAWRLAQHHHTVPAPEAAPTTLARPTESLLGPTETLPVPPVPAATDALVPGGNSGYDVDSGRMILTALLVNNTVQTLTVTGPVRVLGPDGQPVPHATVKIVPGTSGRSPTTTDPWAVGSAPSVRTVSPHQYVNLVLTVFYDCHRDADELSWPGRYPTVEIPFAGFDRPWTTGFDGLFDLGDRDSTADANWLRPVCRAGR